MNSIIGVCIELHQNTLLMVLFAAVEVAESAEAWKCVILHIDWVNMCENSGFGPVLEFWASVGPDIAYCDWGKCFSTFGHGEGSCIINEVCIINVIYAKKS